MNLRQLVEQGDRPFATQPQVARYFPAASVEDARRRLSRSIERGDGPGVIIGGAGIGKSLLLQVLAAQYREKFDVVLLACGQLCTRRALLQAIHFELGLDYRRRDEGELRLSLLDALLSSDESTEGLLLLVDESQALAVHLLEELRLLTNLSRGGAPRVRLVMAGLPALEEKFASPELQSFSQRLAARCYLAPLTRDETGQYVRAQLAASQVDADRLFAAPALEAVFTATDGVPRLVNQLCDRALVLADTRRLEQIDAAAIQAAWADLQQLPTAWEPPKSSNVAATAATSSIVEFGTLTATPPALTPSIVHDDLTELDDESVLVVASSKPADHAPTPASPPAPRPTPVRRPRVFSERVPDAVDPFAESFEEEELVLDSFVTLASIFGTRTPRVENGREPGFSRLVQHALDASAEVAENAGLRNIESSEVAECDREPTRPTIRLAVVNDAPPIVAEAPRQKHLTAAMSPQPCADDAILVIEDESADPGHPPNGVRRENYRQLFSRLRHGT
jgi:type II secretory pathway predicted ATPase ExeA